MKICKNLSSGQSSNIYFFIKWIILSVQNETVTDINLQILFMLCGEMYEFYTIDTAVTTNSRILADQLNSEFLITLNPSGLSLTKLQLKIGALIILLWN